MPIRRTLTAAATGSSSYSLGDRDETWDAAAAEKAMTPAQLPQMHFWRDPDKDADQVGSYKLPFATPDSSPHAVWAAVTAVAAALQGSRGGVSIPPADVAGVKSRVAGYYSKARDKYKDETIQPPWKASSGPSREHAIEMARTGLYWVGDGWTFEEGYADKMHGYAGDGGACEICGEPASNKEVHYAGGSVDLAEDTPTPSADTKPHPYQGDGTEPCTVCGQAADSDVHKQEPVAAGGQWQARLFTEGALSRDGRMIAAGAAFWGQLPLTLMGMIEDTGLGGHSGSQVTGGMQQITRDGNDLNATGDFDTSDWAQNIQRLVTEKKMNGISVDLAPVEWRIEAKPIEGEEEPGLLLLADGEDAPDPAEREVVAEEAMDDMVFVVTKGEIMGATICPMPAFANAEIHLSASGQPERITMYGELSMVAAAETAPATQLNPQGATGSMVALYPEPDQADAIADPDGNCPAASLHCTLFYFPEPPEDAKLHSVLTGFAQKYDGLSGIVGGCGMFTPADDSDEGAPEVLLVRAPGLVDMRAALAAELKDADLMFSTKHDFTPHITVDYGDPADYISNTELLGAPLSFRAVSYVSGSTRVDYPFVSSLTASAAGMVPDAPPAEWFNNPELAEQTGLTVTPEGRVYGHAATWNVCHIAHSNQCITAPHSQHDYGYFMLGELETSEGDRIAVGQVTLDTGHAPDQYGRQKARAHYDNTGTAVADVVVGEDEHGIWVAGALRADATAGQVRKLQGAKISGDWRDVNGSLELVALLAVNVPGFPIPRPKAQLRRQNGDIKGLALVAAGIVGEYPAPVAIRQVPEQVAIRVLAARAEGGVDALARLIGL